MLSLARERIDPALRELARITASKHGGDPDLVEAVLLVENLQRPPWVRWLERAFGRFVGVKSYGVMQVPTDKPVSDEESIRLAVANHFSDAVPTSSGLPDSSAAHSMVLQYNRDGEYASSVVDLYWEIRG